jgi:hypothetical protein
MSPRRLLDRRIRQRLAALAAVFALAWPALALAGGGKPATQLIHVADTRTLGPGLGRWIADIYNTSFWLYGLVVVVLMAGMGLAIGLVFDRLVAALGINLGKLSHHE